MKQATLLEIAKSFKVTNRPSFVTPEDLELCLAWMRNEITTSQAAHALGVSGGNAGQAIATRVKQACVMGLVTVTKTKP